MGNDGGQGRSTSLPPELDAIDSGWDKDTSDSRRPRPRNPSGIPLYSEPPTIPRGGRDANWAARQRDSAAALLRPSERVTAPPPPKPGGDYPSTSTEVRRTAETDPPAARRNPSAQPASNSGLELEDVEDDDDIFDRPTEDVFDRPTLDVQADELSFAHPPDDPRLAITQTRREDHGRSDEPSAFEPSRFEPDSFATDNFGTDVVDPAGLGPGSFGPSTLDPSGHAPDEDSGAELSFESLRPGAARPSDAPTAPPPIGFQEELVSSMSGLRGPARAESLERLDLTTEELESSLPPGATRSGSSQPSPKISARPEEQVSYAPDERTRTSRSPGASFGPPSGLDLADGDDVGPSLAPAGQFKQQESRTLSSEERGGPHRDMKDRFAMGDFSGALQRAELILEETPTDREAAALAEKCRDVLVEMYSSRIAGLDRRVRVIMAQEQVRWLSLDHRSGFLLSMVDGQTNVEDLLDVCGMPRLDALKILCALLEQNVIELG